MVITFLLGNGFDLNADMHTGFRDVYKDYLKNSSSNEVIESFKKRIRKNIDNWGDFELAMADDISNYKTEQDFILCLKDFRETLEEHLKSEESIIKDLLENRFIKDTIYNEIMKTIKSFYQNNNPNTTDIVKRKLENEPLRINVVSFNYTSVFDDLIDVAVQEYMDKHNAKFNVEKNNYYIHKNIIHIHGKLNKESVLGVDNEGQLKKANFNISNLTRYAFLKPFFNEHYDNIRSENAKTAIGQSDVICVFGMGNVIFNAIITSNRYFF